MSELKSERRIGRSILSVVAGIVVGVALTLGVDALLQHVGIIPQLGGRLSDRAAMLAVAYRVIFSVLAAYITARLAPYRPMLHAMIGGWLGFFVALVGTVVTWNRDLGPHWYAIAVALIAVPSAWIGARIWGRQIIAPRF
jgi:hypothetical protein